MPFATLESGETIVEAVPISRMIAVEQGQYPEDALQGYENDRIMNLYYDIFGPLGGSIMSKDEARIKKTAEEKLVPFLRQIEDRLGKCKFLLGDKIHMIDFWVGSMYTDKITNEMGFAHVYAPIVKQFPNFCRYGEDFKKENQAWLDKRTKKHL